MVSPQFRRWFRLMLINYPDGSVPTRWKRDFWREDRTRVSDIQQKHVADYLREWRSSRELSMSESEILMLAGEIVAKAERLAASGGGRLQSIHDVLCGTLETLGRSYDLRLLPSLNDTSEISTGDKDLIIVALVGQVLHFRVFDSDGNMVADADEQCLAERALQIEDLRTQLVGLWPPHELSTTEKGRLITTVTSIVAHIVKEAVH